MALEVMQRRTRDLPLLTLVHDIERAHQRTALARFHLDKHHRSAIERDQIDFPGTAAIVSLQDHVTLSAQEGFGGLLAARAEDLAWMGNGAPRVEWVQTLC